MSEPSRKKVSAKKPAKRQAKQAAKKPMTAKGSEDITPLMAYESLAAINTGVTSSRRNKSSVINRTNKYKNIDDGLIPFKYAYEYGNTGDQSLDVRDAVILCQKAYYNFFSI